MARIRVKRGSEGPKHDPYSYTEITFYFTNPKRKPVIYHYGLGEWLKHGKRCYKPNYSHLHQNEHLAVIFEKLTGIPSHKAFKIPDILFNHMLRKYSKEHQHYILECIEADEAMLRNCH
jgi:hypothetical protein